ncbi:hypothetical protein F5Y00DRAFT_272194 [Daldinia vernicosa]|uniref:uncharacterized protein n=1 Tax=Daldinia vernicosa TaxID=114800 RepID=UPI002008552A|nr:uncharacterized protein F5Y00DRAFT_272194 [Daldinia vernicosa]KAI0846248.1 hypothetical protein F5Y00DRAFT_272194 [Daldinia vernicosa]
MVGCFPKLSFLLAKKPAQKQASNVIDFANIADTAGTNDANDAMSKPDKYKTPSEKGLAVPGTASSSGWKPYTIPYTGTGIKRSASSTNWASQSSPQADGFAVASHAAPPLYITGDPKKKGQPADKKGKQPAGSMDKKYKKAADETHMFKGAYIASRVKPEDRQPIE